MDLISLFLQRTLFTGSHIHQSWKRPSRPSNLTLRFLAEVVTAFLLSFKAKKAMSVYLKPFILRSGVEKHSSLILKKKGEEQKQ